jgi:uncharacterized protein
MFRVVIDTNVLLQIIPRKSPLRKIFDAIINEKISLIFSAEILLEYEEILQRELTVGIAENIIRLIENLPNAEKHEVFYKWYLIKEDYDNNKFSDTAINSAADYFITNDKHFDVLKEIPFPKVNVITPEDFVKLIE